jgi:hypothetical protein
MIERIISFFRPKPVKKRVSVMGQALRSISIEIERKNEPKGCKTHSMLACPICNHKVKIIGRTISGRMVASCGDAFHETI